LRTPAGSKYLISKASPAADFCAQCGDPARRQLPESFDGALPLSSVKTRSMTAPRLYVKELVFKNFAGLPADQLLERMIELSLYAEEKLKSAYPVGRLHA
jgi:hypothetical protein